MINFNCLNFVKEKLPSWFIFCSFLVKEDESMFELDFVEVNEC